MRNLARLLLGLLFMGCIAGCVLLAKFFAGAIVFSGAVQFFYIGMLGLVILVIAYHIGDIFID